MSLPSSVFWVPLSSSVPSLNKILILASKSPRRRALLKKAGIRFRVVPSGVAEKSQEKRPPFLVQELALRKAEAVARKVKDGIVLGADTLVVCEGKILGQPGDAHQAYEM